MFINCWLIHVLTAQFKNAWLFGNQEKIDTYKRTSSSFTLVPDIPHFFCHLKPFHHPKLKCGGHENAASYCREHNWLRVQAAALSASLRLHQDRADHGLLPTNNWVRCEYSWGPFSETQEDFDSQLWLQTQRWLCWTFSLSFLPLAFTHRLTIWLLFQTSSA